VPLTSVTSYAPPACPCFVLALRANTAVPLSHSLLLAELVSEGEGKRS
jgi:hypothetical protein